MIPDKPPLPRPCLSLIRYPPKTKHQAPPMYDGQSIFEAELNTSRPGAGRTSRIVYHATSRPRLGTNTEEHDGSGI